MPDEETFGDIAKGVAKSTFKVVEKSIDATGTAVDATSAIVRVSSEGTAQLINSTSKGLAESIGVIENIFSVSNTYIDKYNQKLKRKHSNDAEAQIKKDDLTKQKWDEIYNNLNSFNINEITGTPDEKKEIEAIVNSIIDFMIFQKLLVNQLSIKHIMGAGYVLKCIRGVINTTFTHDEKIQKLNSIKERIEKPPPIHKLKGLFGDEVRWADRCPELPTPMAKPELPTPMAKLGGSCVKKSKKRIRKTLRKKTNRRKTLRKTKRRKKKTRKRKIS